MSKVSRNKKKRKLEQLRRRPCRGCRVSALCLSVEPRSIHARRCQYCGRTWVSFESLPSGTLYGPDWIELRACKLPAPEPRQDEKPETPCNQIECVRKCVADQLVWEVRQNQHKEKSFIDRLLGEGPHVSGTNFWAKRKKWGRKPMGKRKEKQC